MIEVACAIIKERNKFLITQRGEQMKHPLMWEFPGGKLRPGESPERGLIREIREELNLEIKVDQLLPSVKFDYGDGRIKLIPFICSIRDGNLRLSEHKKAAWITKRELSRYNMLEADLNVVEKLNGKLD